jgi:hypothetical protein
MTACLPKLQAVYPGTVDLEASVKQAPQALVANSESQRVALAQMRKGLEGRVAFPKGMERSGTPESPTPPQAGMRPKSKKILCVYPGKTQWWLAFKS